MYPGLKDEHSYYPYLLYCLGHPISLPNVVPLEVVVLNHNVVSLVAMGAGGSPEYIRSVDNNSHV
jgi:hypothetical protein